MENPRPKWHQWVLWVISLGTWIALTVVLWPPEHPPMSTLVKSENQALLNEVENYLQLQGVTYARGDDNSISVDSTKHQRIRQQLFAQDQISLQTKTIHIPKEKNKGL